MVKVDPEHDYYADLELPSTADSDTIKKQFRLLAKQWHPDRNPGNEIEVIPKFQAIQAAHEILGDPTQKKRYDAERAVMGKPGESTPRYTNTYRNGAKPPPSAASPFPPPPKRDPNLNRPFNSRPRPSSTAEKFAPFTKPPGNQQWDRAKYEEAAKAETLRNLHNMRPQSQGPPRVPPRAAPTAPKPPSAANTPDIPQSNGPSPGFAGLSRTNSGRHGGFTTNAANKDEPPAASSAYAHFHRSERPPASAAGGHSNPPGFSGLSTSPPTQRTRPSMSPLRTTKSSGFEEVRRPGFQHSSSRYGLNTGERTDINGPCLSRSTSVRNSPTGSKWESSSPFPGRPQSQQQGGFKVPPPRHHSSSPRGRTTDANYEWSASETSSSDEERPWNNVRKKATPRKPVDQQASHRTFADNDPALTGHFPNSNYKTTNTNDGRYFPYPVPEANGSTSKPFTNSAAPADGNTQGVDNSGLHRVQTDEVPLKRYESTHSRCPYPKPWTDSMTTRASKMMDRTIRGIPVWALPASIYPMKMPLSRTAKSTLLDKDLSLLAPTPSSLACLKSRQNSDNFANFVPSQSFKRTSGISGEPPSAATTTTNGVFSAADWQDKFRDEDNTFQPQESTSRSRSPTKPNKPRFSIRNRAAKVETETVEDQNSSNNLDATSPGVSQFAGTSNGFGKASVFEPAKFSAEDWAERLRKENAAKASPKLPPRDQLASSENSASRPGTLPEVRVEQYSTPVQSTTPTKSPDAMDIDDTTTQQPWSARNSKIMRKPINATPRPPSSGGVNLTEFKETAPFKPNPSGLNGLSDLGDTLPFQSRAASELNLQQPPSSGTAARHLNLPPPPKPVQPPDGNSLTQESWTKYSERMILYMDAWNIFNCKMIDHFRTRQEQISLAMYHNWVTAVGDGASANNFNGLDFVGTDQIMDQTGDGLASSRTKAKKAGYATYMEWLEQDRVCRSWWDVAFDEHAQCMEDLGRVRKMVKSIREKELGKSQAEIH